MGSPHRWTQLLVLDKKKNYMYIYDKCDSTGLKIKTASDMHLINIIYCCDVEQTHCHHCCFERQLKTLSLMPLSPRGNSEANA